MGNGCFGVVFGKDINLIIPNYNHHNGLQVYLPPNLFKPEKYGKFEIVGRKESIYVLFWNYAILVWVKSIRRWRTGEAITMSQWETMPIVRLE